MTDTAYSIFTDNAYLTTLPDWIALIYSTYVRDDNYYLFSHHTRRWFNQHMDDIDEDDVPAILKHLQLVLGL